MRTFFTFLIIAFFPVSSFCQQKIFIKPDGINGESKDKIHANWIDATAYSGGGSSVSSIGTGGSGAGAGKPTTTDFTFSICLDASVNPLRADMYSGKRIPNVNIEFSTGSAQEVVFYKILLQNVLITNISEGGNTSQSRNNVNVSFAPAQFTYTYYTIDQTGKQGSSNVFKWNVTTNSTF
ncbi:MAG: type VI secretion system tube protein Hcp [Ginsengibacter sp.]